MHYMALYFTKDLELSHYYFKIIRQYIINFNCFINLIVFQVLLQSSITLSTLTNNTFQFEKSMKAMENGDQLDSCSDDYGSTHKNGTSNKALELSELVDILVHCLISQCSYAHIRILLYDIQYRKYIIYVDCCMSLCILILS